MCAAAGIRATRHAVTEQRLPEPEDRATRDAVTELNLSEETDAISNQEPPEAQDPGSPGSSFDECTPLVAAEQASDSGVGGGETRKVAGGETLSDVTGPIRLGAKTMGASETASEGGGSASWPEAAEAAERLQWEEFVEALFAVLHALHLDPPPPDTVAKLG